MKYRRINLSNTYQRVILLISDLHCGHQHAIFPPEFVLDSGNIVKLNEGQKKLYEYWKDMIEKVKKHRVDLVYLIGDAFAGTNPFEQGMHLLTTNTDEQVRACADLLEPICKGRRVRIWSGTGAHELRNVRLHRHLVETLKNRKIDAHFEADVSNIVITNEPRRRILNIAHETTGALVYPETSLSRDIMFLFEQQRRGKLDKDIGAIIRAHRHRFTYIHSRGVHSVITPCWCMWYPYKQADRWYFKFQPDIGFVLLAADKEARFRFIPFLYQTPHLTDVPKTEL